MSYTIVQATIEDTDSIMKFMGNIWKKGHILSYHKELFLYEFQDGSMLNFIVAKDNKEDIVGLFGFIRYNYSQNPDIAGSLWKVDPKIKEPLLGIKMREYFRKNIKHAFFAAPGAGLQTKPIYKVLNMNWNRMQQYYIANTYSSEFKICKNPEKKRDNYFVNEHVDFKKIDNMQELANFLFIDENTLPRKDGRYFEKRFFNYPIYTYDIYVLSVEKKIQNIIVCREVEVQGNYAYRIVDFYGSELFMKGITSFLSDIVVEKRYEYLDFVSFGFDAKKLLDAGFSLLDFDSDKTIIPNFFEPFVQKNIPVYCVWDKTDKNFRQCKADGDQDRPNFIR